MTKMASMKKTHRGNYSRGVAVVLGIMVIFAFMMLVITGAPGKEMVGAFSANDSDPVSGLANVYNANNMRCAFNSMSCNIAP